MGDGRRRVGRQRTSILSNKVPDSHRVRKGRRCPPTRKSKRLENIRKQFELAETKKEQREQDHAHVGRISHLKRKRLPGVQEPSEELDRRKKKHIKRARAPTADVPVEGDPIAYWSKHGQWPEGYAKDANMSHLLARKKSEISLARKKSDAGSASVSSATPAEDKPREAKSAPYKDARYKVLLAAHGSFMEESEMGIAETSSRDYVRLLVDQAEVPKESVFRDDVFKVTCRKVQDKNESRVIQDITRLIVPSAETLATFGALNLQCLTESVNEGWNDSIPITKTRPQPDYGVGFRREAFTEDQRTRLRPFVGDVTDPQNVSYFMATYYMYFPFLTCEVKCGAAALDVADRQNAHSMTLAVRGVVELFRYVGREKELDREILAFSLSHDHRSVRIYGHYAVIDGKKQTYYRHPIRTFDFTEMDGKEKWTAYKFIKNVYEIWMPKHLKRICSAIEEFPPEVCFSISQSELSFTEKSGLSQELGASRLAQSSASSQSSQHLADNHSSVVGAQNLTPSTSVNDTGAVEKPRRKRGRKAARTPSP